MAKTDKFNDKHYIMRCDMPSELFTVRGIKKEYRALAKIWHPDISEVKEALFIMSKINALYNEGQSLIKNHKFYEKERILNRDRRRFDTTEDKTIKETKVDYSAFKEEIKRSKRKRVIELKTISGKCVRFKYLKRVIIELGFMYVSEEHILLEITKLKRKIFMDSIKIVKSGEGTYFKVPIPEIIDSFDTETHGYIVIRKDKGIEPIVTLEVVSGYLKPLACRKICEGIFYDLTALKYMGLTSTGLEKDLLFINVSTGRLHNLGLYFYLHEFNSKLSRAPLEVTESLQHLKPKSNESLIIELVKSLILKLSINAGLKVDDFYKWIMELNSDSLEASLAESQVFNRSIMSVTNHGFNLESYYSTISST